ncbi:AarF/ABC1/UbiB kinase family protein [Agarivorans sp. 1_MG-2023]|uniref:ABC1 kinase family protein n=1 Tax=Agarivorans sp. 1_MG-2023 TaxID=3062634 RepID=UPI0026E37F33|nr:AarF/ABC1/UbiB kinase family protein [Agarivorans sp. 1_MG-2023]MDO6762446.1 AarF/ABC1/UbiB kinase family protein [Agarivorans sp. 1_MG-2023]
MLLVGSNINSPKHSKASKVPSGRLARLGRLGSLASRVAGGMIAEGAVQLAAGKRPKLNEVLLTPNNVKRVADQLAKLRGAAMKVGQLMSMDAGEMLPKEVSELLARLRADADPMPIGQLSQVLLKEWGEDWQQQFQQFSLQPIAAASIGQVHSAYLSQQQRVAIKIQYPGVKDSIDSDVDNVVSLLNISGLLPKQFDYQQILQDAKLQLHQEADYLQESEYLRQYQQKLATHPEFELPQLYEHLTTSNILTMSHHDGEVIDQLSEEPQALRDKIMHNLFKLLMMELFEFGLMQTDPNFANYLYSKQSQKIILLDFGATRQIPSALSAGYRHLLSKALNQPFSLDLAALTDLGFVNDDSTERQIATLELMLSMVIKPLQFDGEYDFAQSPLAKQLRETGMTLSYEHDYWNTPPIDVLLIHRKIGGMYLLASRLKAKVNLKQVFEPYRL